MESRLSLLAGSRLFPSYMLPAACWLSLPMYSPAGSRLTLFGYTASACRAFQASHTTPRTDHDIRGFWSIETRSPRSIFFLGSSIHTGNRIQCKHPFYSLFSGISLPISRLAGYYFIPMAILASEMPLTGTRISTYLSVQAVPYQWRPR